jgi:hypothetical protein
MSSFSCWLADRMSLLLPADERDVVRGDLAESGEGGGEALVQVLGLAARRQAAGWKNWRPWCVLLLATGMGLKLARQSAPLIHISATYAWMYLANWRMADAGNAGFWRLLLRESAQILLSGLWLTISSLAAGVVIGMSVAQRNAAVSGAVCCVALMAPNFANVPQNPLLGPAILRGLYALLMLAAAVLLPATYGLRLSASLRSRFGHRLP